MEKTYNDRIKEIREDADYTQQEVADFLEITRPQYHLYESGKRQIPVTKLKAFCELFNVSADYILGLRKGLKWPR